MAVSSDYEEEGGLISFPNPGKVDMSSHKGKESEIMRFNDLKTQREDLALQEDPEGYQEEAGIAGLFQRSSDEAVGQGDNMSDCENSQQENGDNIENTGLLSSMRLINFMCHENLKIEFGSRVNFIIGQNGSGKSAVLTALMVCFGALASKTQRGHKVSDLIRENARYACITIVLNNDGFDRYRYRDYGKKIIVERRILKDGPSVYRTKSISGKIISSKKEEIIAICQFFRLQVDNPMTILTQDVAKRYLASSSVDEKYQFFLKGTHLDQLAQDYDYTSQKIDAMSQSLQSAKSSLPGIEHDIHRLKSQIESLQALRTMSEKVIYLKKEIVWALTHEKEEQVHSSERLLEQLEKKYQQHLESRDNVQHQIQDIQAKIQTLEAENAELQSTKIRPLDTSFQQITLQISDCDRSLRLLEDREGDISRHVEQCRNAIKQVQKLIDDESTMQTASQINLRQELEAEIRLNETKLGDVNGDVAHAEVEIQESERNASSLQEKQRALESLVLSSQSSISHWQQRISQLQGSATSHARVYGANIPNLLAHLEENQKRLGFKRPPIGPIGIHVKLRDKDWSFAVDAIIGRLLSSFIVTNYEDRVILMGLLKKFNCHNEIILRNDLTREYREPPPQYLTAYRVLEISSDIVSNVLRDLSGLERLVLCRTRTDAFGILEGKNGPPPNTDAAFSIDGIKFSSKSTVPYGKTNQQSKFFDDPQTQIKSLQKSLDEKQKEIEMHKREKLNLSHEAAAIGKILLSATQRSSHLNEAKRQIVNKIKDLKRRLEMEISSPGSKSNLDREMENAKERLNKYVGQIKVLFLDKERLLATKSSLEEQMRTVLHDFDHAKAQLSANKKQMDRLLGLRNDLESDNYQFESKTKKYTADMNAQKLILLDVTGAYQQERAKAMTYCEEMVETRKSEEIEKELRLLDRRLQNQSVNIEDMNDIVEALSQKELEYQQTLKEVTAMQGLIHRLKASIEIRQARWFDFRSHIVLRAQYHFRQLMSLRGLIGDLIFDHAKLQLHISVTFSDHAKRKLQVKDIKSLSGGEKSLTTTCFLLSLWESMESPLRCLDEFDVFMDAANRRVVMRMLIQFAKDSRLQYLFITPLGVPLEPDVARDIRVTQMRDPERGKIESTAPAFTTHSQT